MKILGGCSLILIFILWLYIFEFTNPNLFRFDLADYLYILGTFNNINNTSKERPIREVTVSVKIRQFHKLIYNPIIYLNVLL